MENVKHFFHQAAELLDLPDDMRRTLINPYREITVEVPLRRNDGRLDLYNGYRVQHNNFRGPFKGGIRYHPTADLDDVRALASLMTWKTALTGLPLGVPRAVSPAIHVNWKLTNWKNSLGYSPIKSPW